ncbi:hypothetical protein ACFYNU_19005 [Streptomyces sp. NPDC006643]|uniref:MmyB family transcriptional regulator n=1 Tax=Streptomyces sp. NPDC006643 TaxID=3364756 RepID=UPI0036A94038
MGCATALAALVGELKLRDPDFRTWWAGHQMRGPRQLTKTYLLRWAGSAEGTALPGLN